MPVDGVRHSRDGRGNTHSATKGLTSRGKVLGTLPGDRKLARRLMPVHHLK